MHRIEVGLRKNAGLTVEASKVECRRRGQELFDLEHLVQPLPSTDVAPSAPATGLELLSASPFLSLVTANTDTPPALAFGASVPLEHDLAPAPRALAPLMQIEGAAHASADGPLCDSLAKVRDGVLLLLADSAELHAKTAGVPKDLTEMLAMLVHEAKEGAQVQAQALLNAARPASVNIEALVQAVLRDSYFLQCASLRDFAERVKSFNELRKQIRQKLTEARVLDASGVKDGALVPCDYVYWNAQVGAWLVYPDEGNPKDGQAPADEENGRNRSKRGLPPAPGLSVRPHFDEKRESIRGGRSAVVGTLPPAVENYMRARLGTSGFNHSLHTGYIKALEDNLASVGDDAQLANVDLQDALQRQQQNLQLMSNISKMLHETALSVIRKMGA